MSAVAVQMKWTILHRLIPYEKGAGEVRKVLLLEAPGQLVRFVRLIVRQSLCVQVEEVNDLSSGPFYRLDMAEGARLAWLPLPPLVGQLGPVARRLLFLVAITVHPNLPDEE
jgi:hypothetical protein